MDTMDTTAVPNRGSLLLGIDITFLVMSVTTVGLRCYVRTFMVKRFGSDDWLMLAATVIFCLYIFSSISGVYYGTGRHRSDLTEDNYARAKQVCD